MSTTIVINTPDASRSAFRAIQVTLNHYGFQLSRYHSRLTETGQCLVADVMHCSGQEEGAAREALSVMAEGTTLYVLH